MSEASTRRTGLVVLVLAFGLRFAAAVVTTLTDLNPDSQADAVGFGNTASYIANFVISGRGIPALGGTYEQWGLFLAPFWVIPGPSGFYARVACGTLGAIAVYQVFVVGSHLHSNEAGLIAAAPMAVYPSFVAVQSTLLREAFVLLTITTAARVLIVVVDGRRPWRSYAYAGIVLSLGLIHRDDNLIIFATAISVGTLAYLIDSGKLSKAVLATGALLSPLLAGYLYPTVRSGVEFLAYTRDVRGTGRTVYLPNVIPESVAELVAFSWVGAAYFLFSPFPWMVATPADLIVAVEGSLNLLLTIAALIGLPTAFGKHPRVTTGLGVGLLVAIVLYGVGSVNVGTAMRHRQMFVWVIFLFAGIAIAERFKFKRW